MTFSPKSIFIYASRLLTDLRSIESERIAIVVPGGADLPYMAKLRKEGIDEIRHAVFGGGSYIGICAGAYFGSGFCLFERKDRKLSVVGRRPLALFPGAAIGAVRRGFVYSSEEGATMERLKCHWKGKDFESHVYCNGGPAWLLPGTIFSETTVIARYSEPVLQRHDINEPHPVAVLTRNFGKGSVVLSDVHPEVSNDLTSLPNSGISPLRQAVCDAADLKF